MSALEFLDDPEAFLSAAGEHLAADPVVGTVIATVTERHRRIHPGEVPYPRWWVVVRDDSGRVDGVGMRTAPDPPRAVFLLPMPEAAAAEIARAMARRGEAVAGGHYGVNGALAPARACAEELARLAGGTVRVAMHTRLFELTDLAALDRAATAAGPAGRMRPAAPGDADRVAAWFADFLVAVEPQAGRAVEPRQVRAAERDAALSRIVAGEIWLWQDEAGDPVHLTAASRPQFGVSRIGPVYTPERHRGRGYAATVVAEVSRRLLASGARVCLYTDQANPTSNRIYQRIGFTPVVDMVNLVVEPGEST